MSEDRTAQIQRHRRYATLRWVAAMLSLMLAAGTLIADEVADQAAARSAEEDFYRSVEVFSEIFHEIQDKYVEEIDTQELMEAAIGGMFLALDPHSQFMAPDTFDQLTQSTQGEFFGIGIHITVRDGVLTVIAPIPNTPAAQLGIQPWDRIIEIMDEETGEMVSTDGMSLTEAVRRIKGPRGTQVTIKIFRAPEEPGADPEILEFTITRDQVEIASVFAETLDDHIGYLRLAQFSEATGRDLSDAIREMHDEDVDALILDLRFNTGGLLSQAIEVADLFLDPGELIVSTAGRISTQNRRYYSENSALTDLPVLVLVNQGTASASEIVAGALQDHGRGVIIGPDGSNTFGKGSVQTIEQLMSTMYHDDDGSPRPTAIRLTTARYHTPSGRSIHEVGIEPDIGIDLPAGHERELLRRGLLGDPNTIESEEHLQAVQEALEEHNGNQEEDEESGEGEEETTAPRLEDTVRVISLDGEDEDSEEEFRDLMLDEAIRYLEVYMLMRREIG